MKKIITNRPFLAYLVYFAVISLLRWQFDLNLILFWLGGAIGLFFAYIERIFHVYFTKPHEQLSERLRHLVSQKRYQKAIKELHLRRHEQKNLTLTSALFMPVWFISALYVITSTGSAIAAGLILGLGLKLLVNIIVGYSNLPTLKQQLFWQIQRPISDKETTVVIWLYNFALILITLFVI